jgi:hypothetical protein
LSILPTAVVGSDGIAASASGRAWVATPRSSREALTSASVTGFSVNTTAAQIFSPR